MKDQVWAILLVRNEADIIAYTLRHLVAQGIDGIIVRDNGSSDDTVAILKRFKGKYPVQMVIETEPAGSPYAQSEKMSELAALAGEYCATYILPIDCDELWYSPDGHRLADVMRSSGGNCHHVAQYYHYCTPLDDPLELNPYKRLMYRSGLKPWRKVAFRYFPGAVIGGGNHTLMNSSGEEIRRDTPAGLLAIRHLPCRSFEQMVDKVIRHGQSMDAQHPHDPSWASDGPVHNWLYRLFQKDGRQALETIWLDGNDDRAVNCGFVQVADPERWLTFDPAPYTEWS